MQKAPLRPATPIDAELAEPRPDEETEIGKARRLGESNKKPVTKKEARDGGKPTGDNANDNTAVSK